ncbi:MAG: Flp family type IVb pilin [Sphingomonadaceae bacterium]|nr:Flp family type IVb pilin [Sphingomonadaceae bacterium]
MMHFLKRLGKDASGATAIEYGMILALVFLAIVSSVNAFGNEAISMWTTIGGKVSEASKKAE